MKKLARRLFSFYETSKDEAEKAGKLHQSIQTLKEIPIDEMVTVKSSVTYDDLPPGVTEEQVKERLAEIREYEQNSNNPKFHRSFNDRELEFNFESKHGEQSYKLTNAFIDRARLAFESNDINEKIRLLEETISLFYAARDWHYKTKGGMLYFQDMWEYMHNSQSPCFSWITGKEEDLQYFVFERDNVEPWIIQHAESGFLQPEIYKAFPSVEQVRLRKAIERLASLGKIQKQKEGRSYKITK